MGIWGQMPDGTAIHIDFATKGNCWNMEAACYGNCYGCGCCAKNKRQRYENRIRYLRGMIEEQKHFDNWFDEPEIRALQEKNVKENIRWFKRKLRYYEKKLKDAEA
jgi:hypothetical protein